MRTEGADGDTCPAAAARLVERGADTGDGVTKGLRLVRLENPQLLTAYGQAEAALSLGMRPMQVETAEDDSIDACTTTVHAGITEAA